MFHFRDDSLFVEALSVSELADRFGTPLYLYSGAALRGAYRALKEALPQRAASAQRRKASTVRCGVSSTSAAWAQRGTARPAHDDSE